MYHSQLIVYKFLQLNTIPKKINIALHVFNYYTNSSNYTIKRFEHNVYHNYTIRYYINCCYSGWDCEKLVIKYLIH